MSDIHALPAHCTARVVGADALLHTPFSQPVRLWARQRAGQWEAPTKEWRIRHTPTLLEEFRTLCWALWPSGAAIAEPWKGRVGQPTPAKDAEAVATIGLDGSVVVTVAGPTICIRCSASAESPNHHHARIADMPLCPDCFTAVVVDVEARGLTFVSAPSAVSQPTPAKVEPSPIAPPTPTENPSPAENPALSDKAARRAAMRAALAQ